MNSNKEKTENNSTILVVDDDNITRMMIQKILKKSGYNIIAVESGEKAIAFCIDKLPDLVLLDLVMPGIDGYDTCKALRNIANYNQLPIIILTGLDDIESIEKAFKSGSTDFITKPLNWPLLIQRVRYGLRTRELFNELIESQKKLTRAQNLARIGYWEIDSASNTVSFFDKTKYMLGLENENYPMDELFKHINKIDSEKIKSCIQKTLDTGMPYSIDHSFINKDGVELMLNQQGELSNRRDGKLIIGTIQDITERKKAEELIYFHRYYDLSTSLPNKEHLQMKLDKAIIENSSDSLIAVINISFDKLRSIGGSIGEDFINHFLIQSTERIRKNLREVEEVSRTSTTTSGFLITGIKTIEQIELMCELIISLFRTPIIINKSEYHTTLSIGFSVFPIIRDPNDLIKNSITAQKVCFSQGGSRYKLYSNEMDEFTKEQILLENDMRKALENNEFHAFFQPQINTRDNKITGMEALARWITTDGKIIPPDSFIPIAEETGIIIELGKEILKQSCRFAKKLSESGLGDIRVGVNLSALQFSDTSLLNTIKKTLTETKLDPSLLEIEITESIAMTDVARAIDTLSKIRDMGIKTSMDDFGTGYSSLSYLQKLPLDTLKIDQSFIRPITPDYKNSEIARTIIAMGHSLNMHLIAEGAEEAYHYELLKELMCNEVQGYYFSKPLPKNDFIEFIKNKGNIK